MRRRRAEATGSRLEMSPRARRGRAPRRRSRGHLRERPTAKRRHGRAGPRPRSDRRHRPAARGRTCRPSVPTASRALRSRRRRARPCTGTRAGRGCARRSRPRPTARPPARGPCLRGRHRVPRTGRCHRRRRSPVLGGWESPPAALWGGGGPGPSRSAAAVSISISWTGSPANLPVSPPTAQPRLPLGSTSSASTGSGHPGRSDATADSLTLG